MYRTSTRPDVRLTVDMARSLLARRRRDLAACQAEATSTVDATRLRVLGLKVEHLRNAVDGLAGLVRRPARII